MFRKIFFHEDEHCQIEILPSENLDFCKEEVNEINSFSAEHRDGIGFSDIYLRKENPITTQSCMIPIKGLEKLYKNKVRKFDVVYYGYGSFGKKCKNTRAIGENEHVVLFYDFQNDIVTNIWLRLNIRSLTDFQTASNILCKLSELRELIIVDWNSGYAETLNNIDKIDTYLKKVLSFG